MKKLLLLLALVVLIAGVAGNAGAKTGWKWHATAAGDVVSPDGFTWDPSADE